MIKTEPDNSQTNTCNFNVLIVDRLQIVRDGLRAILKEASDLHIAGEADSIQSLLEVCRQKNIDLIIMDLELPGADRDNPIGIIKKKHPEIDILVLTASFDQSLFKKILEKNIAGFVLKDSGQKELLKAIQNIYKGEKYYSNEITYQLIKKFTDQHSYQKRTVTPNSLTNREIEVLKFICQEFTNQEIAKKLDISVRTVDSHRRNLMQKTGARNTAGLVRFAVERKLV